MSQPAETAVPEPEWWTVLPDRTGLAAYTVLIRAKDDPDETIKRGGGANSATWKDVRKVSADEWLTRIAMTLQDGVPRTFNRLAVELTGRTADVFLGEPIEAGLWLGVESGVLEYCPSAPIRFRLCAVCTGNDVNDSQIGEVANDQTDAAVGRRGNPAAIGAQSVDVGGGRPPPPAVEIATQEELVP